MKIPSLSISIPVIPNHLNSYNYSLMHNVQVLIHTLGISLTIMIVAPSTVARPLHHNPFSDIILTLPSIQCSDTCHFKVDKEAAECSNKNCTGLSFSSDLHYNIMISLSDHTGGVSGVRLQGHPARDLLKCTVSDS